jgi:hypothetical protein
MKGVASRFLCSLGLVCFFFAPQGTAQDKSAQDPKQPGAGPAQTVAATEKDQNGGLKATPEEKPLGMSVLGNQETPKALVIVPWTRSELGSVQGISTILDDSKKPIDREVFMRMLSYYDIRSETANLASPPEKANAARPDTATQDPGVGKTGQQ